MDYNAVSAYANVAAAFGQILGALAVVVSLLYLARQVRDNTRTQHGAAYHANIANSIAMATSICTHPELADLLERAQRNPSLLSAQEKLRWHVYMIMIFRHYDNLHYQHRLGSLETELWSASEKTLDHWFTHPGWRAWFESNQGLISARFRAVCLERLAAAASPALPASTPA
jgi:hypothetical protein